MRPGQEEYFMRMASLVSTRSACVSRQVGCVLTNGRNHVLATGYNGPASGLPHCTSCHRASGKDLDRCPATHAEQNALLQCHDVHEIETAYITASPCVHCIKLLLNTSCRQIVFLDEYPGSDWCRDLWIKCGREWRRHEA